MVLSPLVAMNTASHQAALPSGTLSHGTSDATMPTTPQKSSSDRLKQQFTPRTQMVVDYLRVQVTNNPVDVAEAVFNDQRIVRNPTLLQSMLSSMKEAYRKLVPVVEPAADMRSDEGVDNNAFCHHTVVLPL